MRHHYRFYAVLTLFFLIVSINFAFCEEYERQYCHFGYDKYRAIRYWGRKSLEIRDFTNSTGDAKFLGLCDYPPYKSYEPKPDKDLLDHFNKEFERLIKGDLPFHDTTIGAQDRIKKIVDKHGPCRELLDLIQSNEAEWREENYGPDPGGFFCTIKIERRESPVLVLMECRIVANRLIKPSHDIEINYLGYSTPERIKEDLKTAITENFQKLHDILKRINGCKNSKSTR